MKFPTLPVMRCDPGCGACCGVVMCKQGEYEKVVEYAAANGIEPVKQGLTCPWYQQGVCSVYPVRPGICRAFGHTERLECKHGYNVNVPGALMRRVDAAMGKPTRCLHEVLSEGWDNVVRGGLVFKRS